MAIICFSKKNVIPFVPRYGGNREDKLKTTVGISPLNNDGSVEFTRSLTEKVLDCKDDVSQEIAVRAEITRQHFIDHVPWVKNCDYIGDDENVKQITTGGELYDHGSKSLVDEICLAIENSSVLSKGQLKNFEGDSAGDGS